MALKFPQLQSLELFAAGVVPGATAATFQSLKTIDGVNLAMTDFGAKGWITMQPGAGTSEEQISFTGLVQNSDGTGTITGVSSVGFLSPYTETSGFSKQHSGGATAVVAITSGLLNTFVNQQNDNIFSGDNTFTGANTFTQLVGMPTGTSSDTTKGASIGYVNSVAVSGAPNASTTVKGIVQEADTANFIASTATGSTGARLFVNPSSFATFGANKGIISRSNGTIDDSLIALTSAGDIPYSDGTLITRLPIGTGMQLLRTNSGATAPEWATPIGIFGGTGADGALNVASGTTTINAGGASVVIKNYTSINIAAGATLTLSNPHAGGTLLILKTTGTCTIAGTILLTGFGGAVVTTGNFVNDDSAHFGSSGANGSGSTGGSAGSVGAIFSNKYVYTTPDTNRLFRKSYNLACGSGGGNGGDGSTSGSGNGTGGAGGRGGGSLIVECAGALNFTGTITVNGANGSNGTNALGNGGGGGGGGGGSAGMALIIYNTLTANSGTFNAIGGTGGAGGNGHLTTGAGGGGGSGGGSYTAAGSIGGAGGNANTNGSVGTATTTAAGAGGGGGGGDNDKTGAAGGGQGSSDTNHVAVVANTSLF